MTVRDLSHGEINARRIKARKERCGVKFRGEIQTFRDKFCRVFFEARVRRIKFDVSAPPMPSLATDRALLREAF